MTSPLTPASSLTSPLLQRSLKRSFTAPSSRDSGIASLNSSVLASPVPLSSMPSQEDVASTVSSEGLSGLAAMACFCTDDPSLTKEKVRVMIDKALAYQRKHPDFEGRVDRRECGIERSFLIVRHKVFLLMTRLEQGDILIGQGDFKKVKGAVNLTDHRVVAVAVIKGTEGVETLERMARKEVALMKRVEGVPGVIGLEGDVITNVRGVFKQYILMDCCDKGDLETAVGDLSPAQREELAQECLEALAGIHERQILHRDIKPKDIFVIEKEDGLHVRVGDLGVSYGIDDEAERSIAVGPPSWSSPELIGAHRLSGAQREAAVRRAMDYPHDVWAMGEVLYFLFTGELLPFQLADSREELFDQILGVTDAEIASIIDQESRIPARYKGTIQGMLRVDPKERLTARAASERLFCIPA